MSVLRKNEIYTALIEAYSSEAYGVCRIDGQAVFVPRALIGELWDVRIVKVSSSAVYGRGERLLSASPARVTPDCPHFGLCGGCDTRHMCYEEELRFKLCRVNDALKRIGGQKMQASEIIGADSPYRYRNKAILAVAENDGKAAFGFYRQRSHELIPIEDCLIQNKLSIRAASQVAAFMNEHGIPAYNETSGNGTVRHVFCRKSCYSADAVLCIVASRGFGALTASLVEHLRSACPELTGIVLNINKTAGNTVLSGEFHTLWGCPELCDKLCGFSYDIAPQAFFQVNPLQAEKLYCKALEYAVPGKDELCLDLYCGAGTISLPLASRAGRVIGAEIVPQAVENARLNAERNNVSNVDFICADAAQAARRMSDEGLRPAVIVADPPRKGMEPSAIDAVCSMAPKRVVYVSCNPATLARDISCFETMGYMLHEVCAVDMFPGTKHVETVALLCREI